MEYKTHRITNKPADNVLNTQSVLNEISLRSIALVWLFFDSVNETTIIIALRIRKTIPILSRNGKPGYKYFNSAETGMLSTEAINTEFDVVLFQNMP